jgi:hypothetical protein
MEGTPTPGSVESAVSGAVESVAARTPIRTPTRSLAEREVAEVTETLGLDDVTLLGLTASDWINLGLSVLIFLFS